MDIEAFERMMKPSRKRSRLEPFRAQILELKAKGYADWQIGRWLAENGVKVTRQAVQQFVSKHTGAAAPVSPTAQRTPTPTAPSRVHKKAATKPSAPPASTQGEFDFDR